MTHVVPRIKMSDVLVRHRGQDPHTPTFATLPLVVVNHLIILITTILNIDETKTITINITVTPSVQIVLITLILHPQLKQVVLQVHLVV